MAEVTISKPRVERIKADLALLAAATIWGSAFAAQRIAALHLDAFSFNGTRFLIGALALLPLSWRSWEGFNRRALWGSVCAGLLLFGGAAFQQSGLQFTTAGNAGFITGLYVVLIPIILAIWHRRTPERLSWTASFIAALGLFLLSTGGRFALAPGDGQVLVGAVLWAFHVILIGRLVRNTPVLPLAITQNLVCAMLNLILAGGMGSGLAFQELTEVWWAVIYTGIFSIGLGYSLQAAGQRVAPAADAAILLSAEAVFAALFGWLFLNEQLAPSQLLGCALMLGAMLLAQYDLFKRSSKRD
jgi:drug/metabolite transporter (DMT)-like permease